MSEYEGLGRRLSVIFGALLLIAVVIPWVGGAVASRGAAVSEAASLGTLPTPVAASDDPLAEAGQFELAHTDFGVDPSVPDASGRTLDSFYRLRAYPGAPPAIPHPVAEQVARTQDCGVCHTAGGYAPRFSAYAPVTPHAEFVNCMQCHVEVEQTSLFRESDWTPRSRPGIGGEALAGSPPPIPHELQMRERCAACHSGPAAVEEVRTTHPERVYCQQCHVRQVDEGVFLRGVGR